MSFTADTARRLRMSEINRAVRKDVRQLVDMECARYRLEIERVGEWLNNQNVRRRVVLLSGPSSSGKTTTSNLLCDYLKEHGVDAFVVSLDDFYRGRDQAPRLPDGSYDYESPQALDLDLLAACIQQLLAEGRTRLPRYDFKSGKRAEEWRELTLPRRSVVIFEGIHALHPSLRNRLPKKHVKRVLVHTASIFVHGRQTSISQRQLRLIRRIVRDDRHRGTSAAQTLSMWPQVAHGEENYLFPYTDLAEMVIDTTHAFEPGMMAARLLPLLEQVPADHPQYAAVTALQKALEEVSPVSYDLLPADSVLQEFLG